MDQKKRIAIHKKGGVDNAGDVSVSKAVSANGTPTKVTVERRLKQARRNINKTNRHVVKHVQKWLVERRDNLLMARRSVVTWLTLMLLLIVVCTIQTVLYSQSNTAKAPVAGGTYAEGVVDKITTINPVLASTDSEKAASTLVYSSLLDYDDANKLKGNLASTWSVDQSGKIWTVDLRHDLKWSDGKSLTSDDVVYTIDLIKNADINSPLRDSWTSIQAKTDGKYRVLFTLPNVYMSFPTALTFGVVPKHILDGKSATEIASISTQRPTQLVGSGPFRLSGVEAKTTGSVWKFDTNSKYCGTKPQLKHVTIRTYADADTMLKGYRHGEINAMSSVRLAQLKDLPSSSQILRIPSADGVFALFNTDGQLTSNAQIRNALRLATDRNAIRRDVVSGVKGLSQPSALETPIAPGVYDSVDTMVQPAYNAQMAGQTLDQLGWRRENDGGYRKNGDQTLTINIATLSDTNYQQAAEIVAKQWRKIGVDAKVQVVDPATAQQNILSPRAYDVLIYQLHLGADPDEYAYWSSTQTGSTGLNYSNYSSKRAELLLSNGRTSIDTTVRQARYVAFVKQWQADNPAIALYRPNLYFVTNSNVRSLQDGSLLVDATNRYRGIENWTVHLGDVKATP